MKKQNKTNKTKLNEYLRDTFKSLLDFYPEEIIFNIDESKEKNNDDGGEMAIRYVPNNNHATLIIYQDFWDNKIETDGQKLWIKQQLAHEIGHIFVWDLINELEKFCATKVFYDKMEKTATRIGMILVGLLQAQIDKTSQ